MANILKYFFSFLIESFGAALVLVALSELSIYAQTNWNHLIYFIFATTLLMLLLFVAAKVLSHHLVFVFIVLSFYLLIGHGFIISKWQNRSNGLWVTASSPQELSKTIMRMQEQKIHIKAIKPLPNTAIIRELRGAYHHVRSKDAKRVDVWFHAAPYATKQQMDSKEFSIWITCPSNHLSAKKSCFDTINTHKGGGYLVSSRFQIKAVNNAIINHKLNSVSKPILLDWSQDIKSEISEHLNFNSKIIKGIVLAWLFISSFSYLYAVTILRKTV